MFCGSKAHVLKECAPRNGVFVINPEIAFFRTDIVDYISPYFFSPVEMFIKETSLCCPVMDSSSY